MEKIDSHSESLILPNSAGATSLGGLYLLPGLDPEVSVLRIPNYRLFYFPAVQFWVLGRFEEEASAQSSEENTHLQYLGENKTPRLCWKRRLRTASLCPRHSRGPPPNGSVRPAFELNWPF